MTIIMRFHSLPQSKRREVLISLGIITSDRDYMPERYTEWFREIKRRDLVNDFIAEVENKMSE